MAERPNTTASAISSVALARELDLDAARRAAPDRTGSSPAAARPARAPAPTASLTSIVGSRSERAIDLLGGRRGDGQARRLRPRSMSRSKRSPPAMPPAVLTITASSARRAGVGKAHAQRTVLVDPRARRVTPPMRPRPHSAIRPTARLAANTSSSSAVASLPRSAPSERHRLSCSAAFVHRRRVQRCRRSRRAP